MVRHLRACAVESRQGPRNGRVTISRNDGNDGRRTKIDKSVLTISEPKRHSFKGASSIRGQPALPDLRSRSHHMHITSATRNLAALA